MGRTVIVIRTKGTVPQQEYGAMVEFFNKQLDKGIVIVPERFDLQIVKVGEEE
jgi:hypothetical protein